MVKAWNIRTVYLYLVSFVTLIMLIVGTVNLIRAGVDFFYPDPGYYPGPVELKMRYENQKVEPEVIEEQVKLEVEREQQRQKHWRIKRLAESFAMLVVAAPIYLYHWRRIQIENANPAP